MTDHSRLSAESAGFRCRSQGFSLIELLIVISIIGIIASIAIPNLIQSKAAANEATAIAYLRSWITAQELYITKYGSYADADGQLFDAGLISVKPAARFPRLYLQSGQSSQFQIPVVGRGMARYTRHHRDSVVFH